MDRVSKTIQQRGWEATRNRLPVEQILFADGRVDRGKNLACVKLFHVARQIFAEGDEEGPAAL